VRGCVTLIRKFFRVLSLPHLHTPIDESAFGSHPTWYPAYFQRESGCIRYVNCLRCRCRLEAVLSKWGFEDSAFQAWLAIRQGIGADLPDIESVLLTTPQSFQYARVYVAVAYFQAIVGDVASWSLHLPLLAPKLCVALSGGPVGHSNLKSLEHTTIGVTKIP
jgi:hypothetical protein